MKYAYYPGCSASGTSKECEESLQATMRHLGVELTELEDWNCCGAAMANGVSYLLSLALPARNLALAERAESDLVTGCSRCYMNLIRAIHYTENNASVREKVNVLLAETGVQYSGKARLRHVLDVIINDVGLDAVAEKVKRPLDGLRVAPYYGCCQGMWTYAQFDSVEDPHCFDELLTTLGRSDCGLPAQDGMLRWHPFHVQAQYRRQAHRGPAHCRRRCRLHRHRLPSLHVQPQQLPEGGRTGQGYPLRDPDPLPYPDNGHGFWPAGKGAGASAKHCAC